MKRVMLIITVLVLFGCSALVVCGWWAVSSAAGTRWLLQAVASAVDVEISTERLEGALADELLVEGAAISWADGQLLVGRLHLDVGALEWLRGRIIVDSLEIDRLILRITDEDDDATAAESIEDAADGDVTLDVLPGWLEVELGRLTITDFIYQEFDDPTDQVVIADRIAGSYQLAGQHLAAKGFAYHSPYVQLDGDFDWELTRPHLVMQVDVHLPETCVDPQLFEAIRVQVSFPGQLEFDGDWNGYGGPVRFGEVGSGGDAVWLTAHATGSWRGIRFDDLQGRYLHGELAGDLDLAWIDDYRMHGTLTGTALEPAVLLEDLSGQASLKASGELYVPYDDSPIESRLETEISEVTLRGRNIQGRAAVAAVGAELVSLDVDLNSEGSRVLAAGTVAERVDLEIAVAELAAFHPDLGGTIAAQGWLRLREGSLTGEVAGRGGQLSWLDGEFATVNFEGRYLEPDAAIEVKVTGSDWHYQEWHAARAEAQLSGTPASHRLQILAEGDAGHFELSATGQQQENDWSGVLERFVGRDARWGNWSTTVPAQVAWRDGAVSIAGLQLQSETGAQLDLAVDRWGDERESRLDLTWHQVDLAWLAAELEVLQFAGRTDGELYYEQAQAKPLLLEGHVSARGRVEDEHYAFAYEEFDADLTWNRDGLQLNGHMQSRAGETLKAQVTSRQPLQWNWPLDDLKADVEMQRLDLMRLNRFIDDARLEGQADGELNLELVGVRPVQVNGQLRAEGRLLQEGRELGPRSLSTDLYWDDGRFECVSRVTGAHGGTATLRLTSPDDPELSWPDSGQIDLRVDRLNLAALEPVLPEDLDLVGKFDGGANGRWLNRTQLVLDGQLQLTESELRWLSEDGQGRLPVRDGVADWHWEGGSLSGSWSLNLAEYGGVRGEWQLPLAARMPVQIDPDGPLRILVDGRMQALGILSAAGPLLVQDLRGELEAHLEVAGSWGRPDMQGTLVFADGSAYLPGAGIQLDGLQLRAELSDNRIRIADLRLRSGPGELEGQGELIFDHWQLAEYRLAVVGQRLQLLNFPEVHLLVDPDLSLSGTPRKLSLQGTVGVPELVIQGSLERPEYLPSEDVEIVTVDGQGEDLPFEVDVRVVVELGDQVTLQTAGVDTRFAGGATVTMSPKGQLLAWGEIQLLSGAYNAYGARLQIRQGLLRYTGTPITNPKLRIFAARKVGAVLAGVQVTGSVEAPVVTLYSQPAMPERDILGYMLMGRAVRADRQESDMLAMGAGALLPQYGDGQSGLGITEIDVQGLFVGGGGVRLRHRLAESWELESTLGIESGVDLYYIIEFD